MASIHDDMNDVVVQEIGQNFQIKDLGIPTKFLGCNVKCTPAESNSAIKFGQSEYIQTLLKSEDIIKAKIIPVTPGAKLPENKTKTDLHGTDSSDVADFQVPNRAERTWMEKPHKGELVYLLLNPVALILAPCQYRCRPPGAHFKLFELEDRLAY